MQSHSSSYLFFFPNACFLPYFHCPNPLSCSRAHSEFYQAGCKWVHLASIRLPLAGEGRAWECLNQCHHHQPTIEHIPEKAESQGVWPINSKAHVRRTQHQLLTARCSPGTGRLDTKETFATYGPQFPLLL